MEGPQIVRNRGAQPKTDHDQEPPNNVLQSMLENYEGIAFFKLYAVTLLVLFSAISYGNAVSLGVVLDPEFILDLNLYRSRDFYFNLCIYFVLGQVAGASLATIMCKCLGPKQTLLVSSSSLLLTWLLMLGQIHLVNIVLCIRFLNGFSGSIMAISCLVYLFDISIATSRGGILASFTSAMLFGFYFPTLVCIDDSYYFVLISLAINLVGILVLTILPESPIWLMGNSNDPRDLFVAEKALKFLRPSRNLCTSMLEINRLVGEQDQSASVKMDHPLFYKPLQVTLLLMALYECTFLNAFYLLGKPLPLLFGYFAPNSPTPGLDGPVNEHYMGVMATAQLCTAIVLVNLLIKFCSRRTILLTGGTMLVVVNMTHAIVLAGYKSTLSSDQLAQDLSYLVPIGGVLCTVIQSLVWMSVVEMPIHEYRTYTCACTWIGQWLVSVAVLCLLYYKPESGHIVYFFSSIALIAILLLLYVCMPATEERTTSQIIRNWF